MVFVLLDYYCYLCYNVDRKLGIKNIQYGTEDKYERRKIEDCGLSANIG